LLADRRLGPADPFSRTVHAAEIFRARQRAEKVDIQVGCYNSSFFMNHGIIYIRFSS
jgi:aspartate/tyrosine/aromatic aminotransferase